MSGTWNILWLNTDQQLVANRPDAAGELPLQQALAARGVRFTRAYTALPICSPSRASMLTGNYPHNHGLTENDGRFGGRASLDPRDGIVTDPLRAGGYRCAWFGKWHLDGERGADAYGFEGYAPPGYAYPYSSPEYRAYLERRGLPAPVARIELPGEGGTPAGTAVEMAEARDWFDFESGSAVLDGPVETHEAFFVADLAERWLRDAGGDSPFFLRVDTWGPHPPYVVGGSFAEMFGDIDSLASPNIASDLESRPPHHAEYRDYWAATLDERSRDFALLSRRALQQAAICETALARLVDVLRETGKLDSTIVIFTADHGDAVASNGGVMNKGGLMVEETLRIPMVVAAPGLPPGEDGTLVCNIDLAPTILELCGFPAPDVDGVSLAPLLAGSGTLPRDGLMTEHYGLHVPLWQRAFHKGHWKLVVQEDGFTELYDLDSDPAEMANLAGVAAFEAVLLELKGGLADALEKHGDRTAPALRFIRGLRGGP